MTPGGVYLDANALIELVEGRPSETIAVVGRLRKAGRELLTSELSLAEVLVKPVQDDRAELAGLYERLIAAGGIVDPWPVSREVLRTSAEVRAQLGGKLPDSIHVATAILSGCAVVVSSDKRLRLPAGLQRLAASQIGELLTP